MAATSQTTLYGGCVGGSFPLQACAPGECWDLPSGKQLKLACAVKPSPTAYVWHMPHGLSRKSARSILTALSTASCATGTWQYGSIQLNLKVARISHEMGLRASETVSGRATIFVSVSCPGIPARCMSSTHCIAIICLLLLSRIDITLPNWAGNQKAAHT